MTIQIKIVNKAVTLPKYATTGSAGVDLQACIEQQIILMPDSTSLIPTGVSVFIGERNMCGLILPRSGLGHKHGIVLGNLVGLLDSDYQGEIMLSLWNRSEQEFIINPFDRVAQLIFIPVLQAEFECVDEFFVTERNTNGFGSTGL